MKIKKFFAGKRRLMIIILAAAAAAAVIVFLLVRRGRVDNQLTTYAPQTGLPENASVADGLYSVEDFGAVGDGETDDTEAIQKALDSGAAVFFPEGSYRITSTLKIRDRHNWHMYAGYAEFLYSGTGYAFQIIRTTESGIDLGRIEAPNGGGIQFLSDSANNWTQYVKLKFDSISCKTDCIESNVTAGWVNEIQVYGGLFESGATGMNFDYDAKDLQNGWDFYNCEIGDVDTGFLFDSGKGKISVVSILNPLPVGSFGHLIQTKGTTENCLLLSEEEMPEDYFEWSKTTTTFIVAAPMENGDSGGVVQLGTLRTSSGDSELRSSYFDETFLSGLVQKAASAGDAPGDPEAMFAFSGTDSDSENSVAGSSGDLERAVSVRDFGAKGDGETDDTEAVQAAVDSGDAIFFPAGSYLLSDSIVIRGKSGLNLLGQSATFVYEGSGYCFEVSNTESSRLDFGKIVTENGGGIALREEDGGISDVTVTFDNLSARTDGILITGTKNGAASSSGNRVFGGRMEYGECGVTMRAGDGADLTGWDFYNCGIEGVSTGFSLDAGDGTISGISIITPRYGESFDCLVRTEGSVRNCVLTGANTIVDESIVDCSEETDHFVFFIPIPGGNLGVTVNGGKPE